jgi:F0F1-type ATP synthase assembly protein I
MHKDKDKDKGLKELKKKIEEYKKREAKPVYSDVPKVTASRVCIELVSSVVAGILVGSLLDYLMKTQLIFKIICLLLSCIAGYYSIYKLSRQK